MATITGLRGASIWRDDVKKLLPFYRDVLGLKNPPISRRMSEALSNSRFLRVGRAYLSFANVSGWYGSRTGADDLWVLLWDGPAPD